MKKVLISSIVAVAVLAGAASAFAASSSASSLVFSNYLKVGSTGPEVTALQNWLLTSGFKIPAISSGSTPTGTFGSQTKAALISYQKSVGLPATGYFGPLTMAKVNASVSMVSPNSPVAMSTPQSQPAQTPGVAGTLSFSLWSTPSNGTSVYKGQAYDIVTYKLQAGASDMLVSNLQLDFSDRLWLYADTITIRDDSGAVVGQMSNLNANSFTELTVGSDYRVTVPINNYVVKAAQTKYFTVNIDFLPTSDRTTTTLYVTRAQIRAVDGTGVTDTEVLGDTTTSNANARSFQYGGSTGEIVITANQDSPPNMVVPISTSAETNDVVIAAVNAQSQGVDSTFRALTIYLNSSVDNNGTPITTLVRNVQIKSGNLVYSANSIGPYSTDDGASPVVFTNMAIPLPHDQNVPVYILVDINQDTNNSLDGIIASTSMITSGTTGGTSNNPVAEDSSFTTVAVDEAPFLSSDLTFSAKGSSIDYTATTSAVLGSPILSNGAVVSYPVSFMFSIAAGDNTLYLSADPNVALSTSSSGLASNSSANLPVSAVIANPGNLPGDVNVTSTSGYYVIPAGTSRQFTYDGSINDNGGTKGLKSFSINQINYGTSPSNLSANPIVYYNYAALKVNPVF